VVGYYFEVLETVEEPEAVYEGRAGECIAVREVEKGGGHTIQCWIKIMGFQNVL